MHDRKVGDKKRVMRKLKRQIRQKSDENQKLDVDLEEMALDVAERTQINKNHGEFNTSLFFKSSISFLVLKYLFTAFVNLFFVSCDKTIL